MSQKRRPKRYAFEHLSEDALRRDILVPLFKAMSYNDVVLYHGQNERGKDILMWKSEDFFARVNYVVVAKRGAITGRAQGGSDSASTTAFQVQQALRSTYPNPGDGSPLVASRVIVVASGEIHPQSKDAIRSALQGPEQRAVTFIDGGELADLTKRHLPATSIAGKAAELQSALDKAGDLPVEVRVSKGVTSIIVVPRAEGSPQAELLASIRLKDVSTPAGREASDRLADHIRTGTAITLTREMIESVDLPEVLRQLGIPEGPPERIEVGTRRGGSVSVVVDVEDTSGFQQRLGPLICEVVQAGRESAIARTTTRTHGWALELTIEGREKLLGFKLGLDLDGLNIREQAIGLHVTKALAGGARLTFRNGATELPIASLSVAAGSVEEPERVVIALADALLRIQEFCGKPLALPSEGVSGETLRKILELGRLGDEGAEDTTWSTASVRVDRQAAARLLELAPDTPLGRMATRIVSGFELNGHVIVVGIVESVVDQGILNQEVMDRMREDLRKGEEWIDVQLTPGSDSARVTRRLLPFGAEDEPIGGDPWVQ